MEMVGRERLRERVPVISASKPPRRGRKVGRRSALPPHRECRQYWQRACELILAQADIMEVSRQLELVLFRDVTLDLVALYADA